MRRIRESLRLHLKAGMSYAEVARALKISKAVVGKYVLLARVAGVDCDVAESLSDEDLEARLYRPPVPRSSHQLAPDFALVHQELKRAGVTLMLLWEEYATGNPLAYKYTSFCVKYRAFADAQQRSMRQIHIAGEKLFVDFETAMQLPRRELMIIATGGQGEPRAALSRIAFDSHKLKLEAGDLVIFSSKQIPGNEIAIGRIQNSLATRGIDMITDRQADVHVSGHPGRPELAAMYEWIRPEIILPVHGEMRHMMEHARFAKSRGIPHGIVQQNGQVVRLAPQGPDIVSHEKVGRLILDGDVILSADGSTMNERRRIAANGVISVGVPLNDEDALAGDVEVRLQGVPVEEDRAAFLKEATEAAETAAGTPGAEEKMREAIRLAVRRCATEWTGKKPVVDVLIVRV